jgi:hypothetical protein
MGIRVDMRSAIQANILAADFVGHGIWQFRVDSSYPAIGDPLPISDSCRYPAILVTRQFQPGNSSYPAIPKRYPAIPVTRQF